MKYLPGSTRIKKNKNKKTAIHNDTQVQKNHQTSTKHNTPIKKLQNINSQQTHISIPWTQKRKS